MVNPVLTPYSSQFLGDCSDMNPLANMLSGDQRGQMPAIQAYSGTKADVLDGRGHLNVSKLGWYQWFHAALMNGYNGRVTPRVTQTLIAGTTVFNRAAGTQAPTIGYKVKSTVTLNTVAPIALNHTQVDADASGQAITRIWEASPCGIESNMIVLDANIVATVAGAAGVGTCNMFPAALLAGLAIAQNTALFIAAGQVAVMTITVVGLTGTIMEWNLMTMTDKDVQELTTGSVYNTIIGESFLGEIRHKLTDQIKRMEEVRNWSNDQIAKGNPVPPINISQADIENSKLVQEALKYPYSRPTFQVPGNYGSNVSSEFTQADLIKYRQAQRQHKALEYAGS